MGEQKNILVKNSLFSFLSISPFEFIIKHGLFSNLSYKLKISDKEEREAMKQILKGNKIDLNVEGKSDLVKYLHKEGFLVKSHYDLWDAYAELFNVNVKDNNKFEFFVYSNKNKLYNWLLELIGDNNHLKIYYINPDSIEEVNKPLVVLLDSFDIKTIKQINEICVKKEIPFLIGLCDGSHILVLGWFIPGETACFNDYEIGLKSSYPNDAELHAYLNSKTKPTVMKPFATLMVNIVCIFILRLFYKSQNMQVPISQSIIINLEELYVHSSKIIRFPGCEVCWEKRSYSFF